MARAATAPELALFRTPGQWSKLRAAIFEPSVIYSARINQVFSSWDGVVEITYDTGSGTLANVLPDMTLLIGSSAGAHDVGIVRIRDKDSDTFFIGETSDIKYADNHFLTVIDDFGLWARHVLISAGVPFMDGGLAYSDQHTNFDPTPIMGSHRVLKLTGASISAQFSAAGSYALDSTITGYSWSAPGSSSSSGMTTATPTITWNTVGWKLVYLTLTAANGKTFFGVRYVYIWNDNNPPSSAAIGECRSDVESGGWSFDLTLFDNVDLDTVRDHALVILFAEDYYGDTQQSIGPVVGCENIVVTGWIARESIEWDPEQGQVHFTGYTAQFWLSQIPSYPDGVELVTGVPAAWTEMQGLTVNKGLFHFLRWRTTATRVMDVFLTDDTKYTKEVSSLAQNLWEQLREMAFLQIYARPGVNALNQLYIEVHPQLVPEASRTWPTVMTITEEDWEGQIDLERVTMNEVAAVSLSGVAVNESGVGTAYFSLSAGHVFSHYGKPDIQDRLLVSSQSQANTLCGLYFSWRNNPYPDIPIVLAANNRLIDCFPRQKCLITIVSADTPRGIAYSGGIIPTSVALVPDPETGYLHTEVTFEAETGLTANIIAVDGDVPGSGDISVPPPLPSFPPLPDFPTPIPGTPPDLDPEGEIPVLLHDTTKGLLYTANINTANPQWITVNAGLTSAQYTRINTMFVTPNGALYVAYCEGVDSGNFSSRPFFIARAPSIGGTFTVIKDEPSVRPSPTTLKNWGLWAAGYNPLKPEEVAFVIGTCNVDKKIWIGSGSSFAAGAVVDTSSFIVGGLTYGFGNWLFARTAHFSRIAPNASSVVATGSPAIEKLYVFDPQLGHVSAGTTGRTFHQRQGGNGLVVGDNNLATVNTIVDASYDDSRGFACDPTGMFLMANYSGKSKSSDGGATFSALSSLPVGNWFFSYVAGVGVGSWWVAAQGSSIRLTTDFGTTWLNREGNLFSVAPIPSINKVHVVG